MKTSLRYGSGSTLAGQALVVWSERGIRNLRLLHGSTLAKELADLRANNIELTEGAIGARKLLGQVDDYLLGNLSANDLKLDLQGTDFQQRVWQAMIRVPRGQTLSYQALAAKVKHPLAIRAVANACARNPICLLVPCHRIVRSDGGLGGYYYGLDRKRALLELEGATV